MLTRFYTSCLDLLSPPACFYCQKFLDKRNVLCADCMKQVQPIVSLMMPITKTKTMKVCAVTAYKEPIKSLIVAKGWSNSIASKLLGELIWEKTYFKHCGADYVVPIPLHWTRAAWRGFNQAHEIASILAQKGNCVLANLLKRVKRTQFQSALSPIKRSDNLTDAFVLNTNTSSDYYKDKHIVLVDDLMTTGATLREAAKLLYRLKPASISAVVAARAI